MKSDNCTNSSGSGALNVSNKNQIKFCVLFKWKKVQTFTVNYFVSQVGAPYTIRAIRIMQIAFFNKKCSDSVLS